LDEDVLDVNRRALSVKKRNKSKSEVCQTLINAENKRSDNGCIVNERLDDHVQANGMESIKKATSFLGRCKIYFLLIAIGINLCCMQGTRYIGSK
jgi:hypothetical protein